MNVLGFREAVNTALQVDIGESLTVPVVSLPALAILKLLAWQDRRTTKNTDAGDLLLVIRNYHNAGNNERIWEVATDLLKTHGFDADRAAAALLGRAARRIALPATRDAVVPLLVPGKVFETHSGDMLASAARRMFVDEFADTTVGSLAAFRDGFMQDPSDGSKAVTASDQGLYPGSVGWRGTVQRNGNTHCAISFARAPVSAGGKPRAGFGSSTAIQVLSQ
jgi:predicted nucleotidyltransferase